MEALPEQGTLLSSLPQPVPIMNPLALPPIQHKPIPLPQTWQGTSSNLAWSEQACSVLQPLSNLPAVVLNVAPFSQLQLGPMISLSVPPPSSIPSGTISTSPIKPGHQTLITPSYTGTSQYVSQQDPPLPQSQSGSPHQSSHQEPRQGSPFPGEGGSHQDQLSISWKSSISMIETGDRQSESEQQHSERSMSNSPTLGSTAAEKPSTTPLPVVSTPRYSLPQNISMGILGAAPLHPQIHPRPVTPMTMQQALYLLATGKLAQVPKILYHAPLLNLFNHFLKELLEDPNWAITPVGMDYDHYRYEYILKEEARHFACLAYNMIHQQ